MPLPAPQSAPRATTIRLLRGVGAAALLLMLAATPGRAADSTADESTRALLEQLEERKMPDVTIWVLERVTADPAASAGLKAEVPFRRALALVALSRTEADGKKRAAIYDEAEKQIDQFIASGPSGRQLIDAYTQKGNLLMQRGKMRLEQAKRPGADTAALRKEAIGFFDQAIRALEGKVKPGEEIKTIDNAEDAVLKEFRGARDRLATMKPKEPAAEGGKDKDKKPAPKPPAKRDPKLDKEIERLENDLEAMQAKLVQTRLMVAGAIYEKSRAFDEKSKEWTAVMEESTKQFKELAEKYPKYGGGALAQYYAGRNLAALGKRADAVSMLGGLVALEQKSPVALMLRAKALATSLECWQADKKIDAFDAKMRDFAVDKAGVLRNVPEADRLALKYRAAVMLKAQGDALTGKDKAKGKAMLEDARKLAMDVARVNRDFGEEARELVQSLGKDVGNVAEQDFDGIAAEAKVAVTAMQEKQAEAKKLQAEGKDATAALAAAEEARKTALATYDAALAKAGAPAGKDEEPVPEEAVNRVRYMKTYLLYDAKRYAEAGDLGILLVEKYPNAMGSRQAGMIAVASLQQLAKGSDAAAAAAAKEKIQRLAATIAKIWPGEKEGAEALGILLNSAMESNDVAAVIGFADALPAAAAGRDLLLGRAGMFLWRQVLEQGRAEEGARAPAQTVATWRQKAVGYLDAALKGLQGAALEGTAVRVAAGTALTRAQIALDEGDAAAAVKLLEAPKYGPWTLVNDPKSDPSVRDGAMAEQALTVTLRAFVQGEQFDKAQQAMDKLEAVAGAGESEEKSAKLTGMYFAMAKELQEQLERLGAAGADAGAREKAVSILDGFEKFLDRVAQRDPKASLQMWVATTYLALGSGKGTGSIVPKPKAEQYLDRAAAVYTKLLEKKGDADVTRLEPSIRLKIASVYRTRGKWNEAQEQIDWILSDAKRQNSLDTQVQAAEILQAAAQDLAATDAAAAEAKFREATAGRKTGSTDVWGWGGIASKVGRQAFSGNDDKALKSRELFFTARLNQATCLLARAQLPGKSPDQAKELLSKAEAAVALTRKMYPELGGAAMQAKFEKLLKDIQKQQGAANPRGFAELDEKATAAAAPAPAQP